MKLSSVGFAATLALAAAGAGATQPSCDRECLAFGWGYFDYDGPITFYIAEVFKVTDGKIRQIEAVLITVPFRMESGW
jgi:hypothetical protein